MPIIEMHMMEGRSGELKRSVAAAVTEAVSRTLACSPETVRILITEHGAEEFYVAGQTMAQRAEQRRLAELQEQGK
ncbi:tautomerase family protein [Pseudothauera rhizosphaerae]|uniref:4-oxalocrotonate tautomerase n=1 Tax=Pseudothauera rhizosphaerae TaxID=2565932 RepID=A0A4S4A8U3_9RHOO|nr:tautomerase family protein [Pseudothauera rhizosphaerae]THF55188.1 4-oxalocrotonate tautomerase [Pseudothauera rhizosphaerae]